MRLYLEYKAKISMLIDYITIKLPNGKIIDLNWDSTERWFDSKNGKIKVIYKGVYYNEEYANDRIKELEGFTIENIGIYRNDERTKDMFKIYGLKIFKTIFEMIKNGLCCGNNIEICYMEFSDGAINYIPQGLPYKIKYSECDHT